MDLCYWVDLTQWFEKGGNVDAYLGLFLSAFLSATLLPGSSEALLTTLVYKGGYSAALLLIFATAGNVTGSVFNWICGTFLMQFQDKKWFPVSAIQIEKATRWYNKYGTWSLLFAWLPIIGDPLTVVAGILRAPFWLFLILVTAGKLFRYGLIIAGIEFFF
ncbi:MAG: membrane protein YqaA with SNARE-associated domain [Sneathiella sp.]